ncbi:ATPAse domain prokaryote protein [Lasiodiplodia theobromae]|uniref:ATPAse domain prokaryote protein n=1 Tax=Lasiodiplodia theobromae TaxID=45133 RepID=UPI0015C347DE|nr:ATPAse domain prokaryote protein [Lasiodiplodia theobromae]KAF4539773.1 ATPAse domain prokaryote protein [Lasiodiplodia theobromae]
MYGYAAPALRARRLQPALPRLQRSARSTLANRRLAAYTVARQARAPAAAPKFQLQPRRLISGGSPAPQPGQPDPTEAGPDPSERPRNSHSSHSQNGNDYRETAFKMFESAMTTFASVAVLGIVGYSYTRYYKHMVLEKMDNAFNPGDPVLDLARGRPPRREEAEDGSWIIREEQAKFDSIIRGEDKGRYHLLIGEKGTGKTSMLIEAMSKIDGDGVAMFEAHADPEIFRIRLGKALDFEFHEDNIGSLFSIRGPRDASALLDVERAFNKLEKVALKRRDKVGRPLILVINSVHLIRDDDEGKDLLELLQQRAEQWAAANLVTVILNSDDYWVYERLKQYATRMEVTPIRDLEKKKAISALKHYRWKWHGETPNEQVLETIYDKIGGRLSFLSRVAKSKDMLALCDKICEAEKTWFLNQCWILGMDMDDDVMDQQKYASAAMVLAKALVDQEKEMDKTYDPEKGHILPQIPLHKAREIMTRADFIQSYDHINVFTIDSRAMVRADSVPMQRAFREICELPGFDKFLEDTLERIGDIESLGRTRELTIKDLWEGGKYKVTTRNAKGYVEKETTFETVPGLKDVDDDDDN